MHGAMPASEPLSMFASFAFSFLLTILLVPTRWGEFGGGIDVSSVIAFPAYFLLSVVCLKKYALSRNSGAAVLTGLLFGQNILFLGTVIDFIYGGLWFLPHFVLQIVSILSGFLFWKLKTAVKMIPVTLGTVFMVLMFFYGFDYWLHYRNFGTFTGRIEPFRNTLLISGIDGNRNQVSNQRFQNRIVLLDFWTTSCGVCFQKFPKLEKFNERWKADESVVVYAVNSPLEEDSESSIIDSVFKRGYRFPILLPDDADLAPKFGVARYPTTFVIDRQGMILYRGSLEGAISLAEEIRYSETN